MGRRAAHFNANAAAPRPRATAIQPPSWDFSRTCSWARIEESRAVVKRERRPQTPPRRTFWGNDLIGTNRGHFSHKAPKGGANIDRPLGRFAKQSRKSRAGAESFFSVVGEREIRPRRRRRVARPKGAPQGSQEAEPRPRREWDTPPASQPNRAAQQNQPSDNRQRRPRPTRRGRIVAQATGDWGTGGGGGRQWPDTFSCLNQQCVMRSKNGVGDAPKRSGGKPRRPKVERTSEAKWPQGAARGALPLNRHATHYLKWSNSTTLKLYL